MKLFNTQDVIGSIRLKALFNGLLGATFQSHLQRANVYGQRPISALAFEAEGNKLCYEFEGQGYHLATPIDRQRGSRTYLGDRECSWRDWERLHPIQRLPPLTLPTMCGGTPFNK